VPEVPDLVLDTVHTSAADNALAILDLLEARGFLARREVDAVRGGDEATLDELDDLANEGTE
jgi:hypothetical protein